ncbi:MAG: acyl-CoA synthetase [Nevskia sp.]|nr:acyl-CoA synthetase [Nevskia sp.]
MSRLPLIEPYRPDAPLIIQGAGTVSQAGFVAQASALAGTLPQARFALNLCESRGAFMLGFAAALLRGQTCLLPPDRSRQTVSALRASHRDSCVLADFAWPGAVRVPPPAAGARWSDAVPTIAAAQVATLAFTSGSTGVPAQHAKTWQQLAVHARLLSGRLGFAGASIVATVPPQHLFGLETTVMSAFAAGAVSSAARPFFARDVAQALAQADRPRLLVTTPVHLDALVRAGLELPELDGVVSATAPLPAGLAQAAERLLGAPVHEVYGSTESGGLATRRTVADAAWLPLPGVSLRIAAGVAVAAGPHLAAEVALADLLEPAGGGRFRLLGRSGDLLKVAGKRMSLADLGQKLRAIPGVVDAVVFRPTPAQGDGLVGRPAALVVAPGLDERQILQALGAAVDPAFLPRPLRRVARLPRNDVGKLPQAALERMLGE